MGLRQPFTDAADFSGIADGLFINGAMHRANITVDEHGTEAAAVTAIAMAGAGIQAPPHVQIRADHPFAFAIINTRNQAPLFMGTVTDPGAH
jgi:serpin B